MALLAKWDIEERIYEEIKWRVAHPEECEDSMDCCEVYRYFKDDEEIDRDTYYDTIEKELKHQRRIDNIAEEVTYADRKNYGKKHKRLKKVLKDDDEVWRLHSEYLDGFYVDCEWDYFLDRLTDEMVKRNPSRYLYWETPDPEKESSDTGSDHFHAEDGKSLFEHFGIDSYCKDGNNKIKINDYGNTGLHIETECRGGHYVSRFHDDEREIVILPACRDGFYRDWDRDGICVAEPVEE